MVIVPVSEIPTKLVPTPSATDVYDLCLKIEQLCKEKNGLGLAAVQVGIPWKVFVIRIGDEFEYYADCIYSPLNPRSIKVPAPEGCLSIPNKLFNVWRWDAIMLKGKKLVLREKPTFENVDIVVEGRMSVVFQHEIDHQNNVLISHMGEPIES